MSDIDIVLTGTIVPNAILMTHVDTNSRRAEYLRAIAFYRQFGHVWFLENSTYCLEDDTEFRPEAGFSVCRTPASTEYSRGKGFQEFETLDYWMQSQPHVPERWLKVTGRYLILNFSRHLQDCRANPDVPLVINQHLRQRSASTLMFCVHTNYYQTVIQGIHRQCDDRQGDWVERVLFRRLQQEPQGAYQLFRNEPQIEGICASNGKDLAQSRLRQFAKQCARATNRVFDKRYLHY